MSSGTSTVLPRQVKTGKLRLFDASGSFHSRITSAAADRLTASGLAEWRGDALRLVSEGVPKARGWEAADSHPVAHTGNEYSFIYNRCWAYGP